MIKEKDTTWILLDDNIYSYSGSHNKNIKWIKRMMTQMTQT